MSSFGGYTMLGLYANQAIIRSFYGSGAGQPVREYFQTGAGSRIGSADFWKTLGFDRPASKFNPHDNPFYAPTTANAPEYNPLLPSAKYPTLEDYLSNESLMRMMVESPNAFKLFIEREYKASMERPNGSLESAHRRVLQTLLQIQKSEKSQLETAAQLALKRKLRDLINTNFALAAHSPVVPYGKQTILEAALERQGVIRRLGAGPSLTGGQGTNELVKFLSAYSFQALRETDIFGITSPMRVAEAFFRGPATKDRTLGGNGPGLLLGQGAEGIKANNILALTGYKPYRETKVATPAFILQEIAAQRQYEMSPQGLRDKMLNQLYVQALGGLQGRTARVSTGYAFSQKQIKKIRENPQFIFPIQDILDSFYRGDLTKNDIITAAGDVELLKMFVTQRTQERLDRERQLLIEAEDKMRYSQRLESISGGLVGF